MSAYRDMDRDLKPANVTWWDVEARAACIEQVTPLDPNRPCDEFGCFGFRTVAECDAAAPIPVPPIREWRLPRNHPQYMLPATAVVAAFCAVGMLASLVGIVVCGVVFLITGRLP